MNVSKRRRSEESHCFICIFIAILFYFLSFLDKLLDVTYALSILAQCVHELVPPSDLQPIVKHLVDKFVHDRSANESIVCGLHTIREMCSRYAPLFLPLTPPPLFCFLLSDLCQTPRKHVSLWPHLHQSILSFFFCFFLLILVSFIIIYLF